MKYLKNFTGARVTDLDRRLPWLTHCRRGQGKKAAGGWSMFGTAYGCQGRTMLVELGWITFRSFPESNWRTCFRGEINQRKCLVYVRFGNKDSECEAALDRLGYKSDMRAVCTLSSIWITKPLGRSRGGHKTRCALGHILGIRVLLRPAQNWSRADSVTSTSSTVKSCPSANPRVIRKIMVECSVSWAYAVLLGGMAPSDGKQYGTDHRLSDCFSVLKVS